MNFIYSDRYGSRRLRDWLQDLGHEVGRKKVQGLMRTVGLTALYPKRNLSKRNQAHKVYSYLLRGVVIDRPNQAWAADVTLFRWPEASCIWWQSSTGIREKCWPGRSLTVWMRDSALRRWRPQLRDTADPRYSIRITDASSPARPSLACSRRMTFASAWMGKGASSH